MKLTAQEIYEKLINQEEIKSQKGIILFTLADVKIIVKRRDVVGNILQEWLEGWLSERGIDFEPNPNTQMPPDVFLDIKDHTKSRLEIKAFNNNSGPGFDIADFKAFVEELVEHPYHLDTDFLIFGYTMDEETGDVAIKNVWLKKIWEITKPMDKWPITLQYKNKVVSKMRPGNWWSERTKYKLFESKEDYLAAFEETVYQCSETHSKGSQWRNRFCRSYKNYYGKDISIPKWDEIKSKYGVN